MRARILDFVQTLRARGGVDVSVAESLDALVAVAAVGVEREAMREALAAALVKHEADRPAFDRLFDEAFPLAGGAEEGRRRRRGRGAGGGTVPAGAAASCGASGGRVAGGWTSAVPSVTRCRAVACRSVPASARGARGARTWSRSATSPARWRRRASSCWVSSRPPPTASAACT